MVSILYSLLKLPFWVLMAAEFFANSLAPGSFCWIIVAVGSLWIVTLFKQAALLCSSYYCRLWNARTIFIEKCIPTYACRETESRNRPVNHLKTHCWMLWLWTMFNSSAHFHDRGSIHYEGHFRPMLSSCIIIMMIIIIILLGFKSLTNRSEPRSRFLIN